MKNSKKRLAFLFASASILFITTADARGVPPQSTSPYYYGMRVKPSLKLIKDLEKKINETKKRCDRATLIPKKECKAELIKLERRLRTLKILYYA